MTQVHTDMYQGTDSDSKGETVPLYFSSKFCPNQHHQHCRLTAIKFPTHAPESHSKEVIPK